MTGLAKSLLRPLIIVAGLLLVWQAIVWATAAPPFILPGPGRVVATLWEHRSSIVSNAGVTFAEIGLGLVIGVVFGAASALVVGYYRPARRWLMPVLVASQAVPVFAIAPVLVLWLGYGMASKVMMAVLIIFFPVTAAFLDGLRRTDPGWIDLARSMTAGMTPAKQRRRILRQVRIPAALPALASGIRVAAAVAPIGAVVGEWVGSSAGLGHLMLKANGRMQVDLVFAALLTLAVFSVLLWFTLDKIMSRLLRWQTEGWREQES